MECDARSWPEFGSPAGNDVAWVAWSSPEWGEHAGDLVAEQPGGAGGPYQIIRCTACTLLHAVPLPGATWLGAYYAEQFYQVSKPEYVTRYTQDAPWWALHHTRLLHQLRQALPGATRRPLTLLDIGLGPGLLLDQAHRLGWQTWGTECNPSLVHTAQEHGHSVLHGTLGVAHRHCLMAEQRFDAVSAWEVLEHVPDPATFLRQAWDLLLPGGVLGLVCPNDFNPLQLQAQQRLQLGPYWCAAPEHLTYFTPATLKGLLERCGFTVLAMRGTYPLERFLLPTDPQAPVRCYVGNDALGRQCHQERMAWELDQAASGQWGAVEQLYEHNLARHRIGREIVAIARRREYSSVTPAPKGGPAC